MKISVVIPTMTARLLKKLVDSIIQYTSMDDLEFVIVANGAEEELKTYVGNIPNANLIWFDKPLGPVKALNEGIKAAKGEYILLVNDDCAVLDCEKDYWINELLKPFENPKVAVTGPFKMPPVLGTNGLNFTEDKIKYGFILFFCAVIPRRIFDEIGILDDTLLCGVDVDFCMRVKEKGYKIQQVPEKELDLGVPGRLAYGSFPFYHEGEGTVHDFYGEQWQKMLKTDVKALNEKYGKSEKKVSIVIPTMNRELVLRCVKSIIKYSDLTNMEIIVVANGADKKLKNDIKYLQDDKIPIKLLWYDEAIGPIKPYNIGIKEANAEYVLLLNDDCEITESKTNQWIDALMAPFFEIVNMGCVGSEIYICHYDREPMNIDYALIYFYCAMIPKRVFNEIGFLDESLKCSVDLDFCLRLQQNGYVITKAGFDGEFPIKHEGRVSVYKNYTPEEWFKIINDDNFIIGKRYSRISIIITVYGDRLDEVIKCLESVYKNTDLSNTEVVVIANAVSKRVDDYLKSLDYIRYYFYKEALGAVGAINKGLEKAVGLIKVMLNQDVVILNGDWLSMLVEPFKDKNVGATGPLMRPIEDLEYNCLHGFCFALRDKVYKEIGPYDTNFNPGCFEDVDYSVRIQKAGYKIVQVPERMVNEKQSKYGFEGAFPIFHKENHQNWMESEAFTKNKKYFYDKHKEYKFMEREIVMPWWPVVQKKYELIMIQEFLKNYKIEKVLEVGTFRGGTAMLWAHMVAPLNGHVYCADMRFDWSTHPNEHTSPLEIQFPRQVYNNSEYEKYVTEIQGDTHDKDFVKKVADIAGEVDLLFIDGDHSYDGVKQDFENYMSIVKSGGYIMFHDITESDYHNKADCRVHLLWNQLKDLYESWEFFDNNEYPGCPARSMGIGIIQIPQKGNIPEKYYKPLDEVKILAKSNYAKVTAYISTKDRYFTTLPTAIVGIASQSIKPNEFILIDDGEQKDLRDNGVYDCLFKMLDEAGIKWKVLFGKRKGQVANHQLMLTEARNDIIWRVDDDNFPESTVLESLLNKLLSDDKIGAVAGRSIIPGGTLPRSQTSGMINDLYTKPHIQWSKFSGSEEVDHLHNTFLFRKEAAKHGYHMGLSPVGHREETMFSYGMKLAGWKVIVMGDVNTWHLRQPHGGIRSFNDGSMWAHDEEVFKRWMSDKSERRLDNSFIAVLDSGLGDHFDFLSILPEIKAKHKNIILATCYPDVFKDEGVTQISIAEASARLGNIESHNIYKFMAENNWKSSIKDAYRKLYGII